MAVIVKADYQTAINEQKKEAHSLVMAGLEQIKGGKTKDFYMIFDRLEEIYRMKLKARKAKCRYENIFG